ncbi:hypothetical protein BCV69DRAFT_284845 [Microstroma glucosiphilum]|uniref:DDHD domain-containing protein n=1 Tax=Pseudomicrostroma glucosiphilum TaxID=1684307 RepID=A0A316U0M8_9BASI|nr:hypothetical protein BCV69DRAFT_284845 [Pseudomicrostroma glucosiphilum]PWN18867.1 hypothetical protein BCV69DRAFT_284845 [Pseudomicrostroma glucosiphilum]
MVEKSSQINDDDAAAVKYATTSTSSASKTAPRIPPRPSSSAGARGAEDEGEGQAAPQARDDIAASSSTPAGDDDDGTPTATVTASTSTSTSTSAPARSAFLRSASIPTLDVRPPKLTPRWLFAEGKYWTAFGIADSARLEEALVKWKGEMAKEDRVEEPKEEAHKDNKSKPTPLPLPEADPTQPLPSWRVPVGADRLYEVDLRPSPHLMHPVFWKAPSSHVRRGSWFFESSRIVPCDLELTAELTRLYEQIRPWTKAYAEELRISAGIGAEGEEKLKCPLASLKGSYVIFSGSHIARIYQEGVSTRLAKTLLTAWAGEHGGGTVVIRGWDQAQKLMRARRGDLTKKKANKNSASHGRSVSMSKKADSSSADGSETPKQHAKGDESPMPAGSAQPPNKEGESAEGSPARKPTSTASTSAQQADLWSSLTSRLGSWGYSGSSSSQLTEKQRADVAESFKEAQARIQETRHEADTESRNKSKVDPSPLRANITADTAREDATADEESGDEDEEWEREKQHEEEDIELILCWHGIGQKLADEWKKLEFSISVIGFQSLVRSRAKTAAPIHIGGPGFAGLAKGKRLVFLPINWRATLNDFQPTKEKEDDDIDDDEHLNNQVGLDDIFGTNDSIPLARQVTKNLLLDIPLFLSHHRHEVLRRCVAETNRAYALYCQRNPSFVSRAKEKGSQPKVSMICHSLGAALAIDILSAQPTRVEPYLSAKEMLASPHLAYNTRSLYLVGSPAALFYYLQSRQLIARKGRELTKGARKDEALDRPDGGQWGCLSADRVWNIFNSTDPIGTCLNGCVDAKYASKMPALATDKVVNGLLSTLPGSSPDVYRKTPATAATTNEGLTPSSSSSGLNGKESGVKSKGAGTPSANANGPAASARSFLDTWSKRLPGPATSSPSRQASDHEGGDTDDITSDDDDAATGSARRTLKKKSARSSRASTGRRKSGETDPWAVKWSKKQEANKAAARTLQEQERGREEKGSGEGLSKKDDGAAQGKGEEGDDVLPKNTDEEDHDYPPTLSADSADARKRTTDGSADDEAAREGAEMTEADAAASARASTDGTSDSLAQQATAALAAAITGATSSSSAPTGTESQEAAEEAGKTVSQSAAAAEKGEDATALEGQSESAASSAEDKPASKSSDSRSHTRATSRFLALNPLGRIDYVLPRVAGSFDFVLSPAGQLLEYLGMLQAHAAYWSNESFADLVLASSAAVLETEGGSEGRAAGEERKEDEGEERWRRVRRRMFGEQDVPTL